ncbi:MAG: FAD-dependent oxidoreductase, partial [Verrucomicrobiota bacterium]
QGLAGTTLAWEAYRRGLDFQVVERGSGPTASGVAAGLVTPVTGRRLVKNPHLDLWFPVMQELYALAGEVLGQAFFKTDSVVRLLNHEEESDRWATRAPEMEREWRAPERPLPPELVAEREVLEWVRSGWLDVPAFLERTRLWLRHTNRFVEREWFAEDPPGPFSEVVFCQGYQREAPNPYFDWVPFRPARGELLTVALPGYTERRTINAHGVWLKPHAEEGELYRLGATYDWSVDRPETTARGRADLEERFRKFYKGPYQVVEHLAGVRPVIQGRQVLIGRHPSHSQLSFFNGLGSKGVLEAPWFAGCLLDHLQHDLPLPEENNVRKNL